MIFRGRWRIWSRPKRSPCNTLSSRSKARIHFLRGNLCFPRGDIEGCLREHGIALELARSADLLFPRDAIEVYLEAGDWDRAQRSAAELEQYTRSEPLPFADFYVARGRALAAFDRGQSDIPELAAELERVRDEGERIGIRVALSGIQTAINQLRG